MKINEKNYCDFCKTEIPIFKIKTVGGLDNALLCCISEGIDGKPGYLETMCFDCIKKMIAGECLKVRSIDE